ncbi:MAG TPA: hypothetical protein VE869_15715 [Gemmatimonas sp.]|nr:hypothetical protein [Gemmatimonas sp.]
MSRAAHALPTVLRAAAVLIAIAAVVDPSFRRERPVRPEVAVVVTDASATLVDDVRGALAERFVTVESKSSDAFANAAATVLVGSSLPTNVGGLASPAFTVSPLRAVAGVRIAAVRHPSSLSLDASARIDVDLELDLADGAGNAAAPGDSIVVTLRAGPLLVDRVATPAAASSSNAGFRYRTVALSYTPARAGLIPLQLHATRTGSSSDAPASSRADIAIDVRDSRSRVLFHDPRPSWMSTFVRRELERDARVAVTSRVVTARGISADAGRPPIELSRLGPDSPFDVVVIGAPDALTSSEVAGLERFLRRRGGSVVLLLDGLVTGAIDRLTRTSVWTGRVERDDVALSSTDTRATMRTKKDTTEQTTKDSANRIATLRVTEWTAPRVLPVTATPLLKLSAGNGDAPAILWRMPVGAGTLVVSGALDAWRFRDSTQSSFGTFWRNTIASLGESAVQAVGVSVHPVVVRPGDPVEISVSIRDQWTGGQSSASVVLRADVLGVPVRLWPDAVPGFASGVVRAPNAPGRHTVTVMAEGLDETRATTEFVVVDSAVAPAPSDEASLQLWARTHGGVALRQAALSELPGAVLAAIGPSQRIIPWYPMRSTLWIVPFAGLLAAEWWIRRRRGLA